jgi:hypothetical protein
VLSPPSIAVRNNANVLRESTKALHYSLLRMPATLLVHGDTTHHEVPAAAAEVG